MVTYNGERIVDAAFAEQVYEAVARIPVKWLPTDR